MKLTQLTRSEEEKQNKLFKLTKLTRSDEEKQNELFSDIRKNLKNVVHSEKKDKRIIYHLQPPPVNQSGNSSPINLSPSKLSPRKSNENSPTSSFKSKSPTSSGRSKTRTVAARSPSPAKFDQIAIPLASSQKNLNDSYTDVEDFCNYALEKLWEKTYDSYNLIKRLAAMGFVLGVNLSFLIVGVIFAAASEEPEAFIELWQKLNNAV